MDTIRAQKCQAHQPLFTPLQVQAHLRASTPPLTLTPARQAALTHRPRLPNLSQESANSWIFLPFVHVTGDLSEEPPPPTGNICLYNLVITCRKLHKLNRSQNVSSDCPPSPSMEFPPHSYNCNGTRSNSPEDSDNSVSSFDGHLSEAMVLKFLCITYVSFMILDL